MGERIYSEQTQGSDMYVVRAYNQGFGNQERVVVTIVNV